MRFALTLIFAALGLAIFLSLGVWQVQRMGTKGDILAEIDARISAAPVALPVAPDPARDRYLSVTASGTITEDELTVLVSTRSRGAGYRVISAFETDGRRILLDRGYVGLEDKETPRPRVEATVTGNLHWPDEVDAFTPETDRDAQIWFARDVPAMARELDSEPVLLILRASSEENPPATPLPVDGADIANDHLQYAVTWFGLAAIWALMALAFIRRDFSAPNESAAK